MNGPGPAGARGALLGLAFLSAATALVISRMRPLEVVPASAPAVEFSAERAMRDVREVARAPHPVGSAEHARVEAYLRARLEALGLGSEVQEATVEGIPVRNVLARLPGREAGRPGLLLSCHYDSAEEGPGASDDGSGVAGEAGGREETRPQEDAQPGGEEEDAQSREDPSPGEPLPAKPGQDRRGAREGGQDPERRGPLVLEASRVEVLRRVDAFPPGPWRRSTGRRKPAAASRTTHTQRAPAASSSAGNLRR